eukprot:1787075-Rhodomonas_salina.1
MKRAMERGGGEEGCRAVGSRHGGRGGKGRMQRDAETDVSMTGRSMPGRNREASKTAVYKMQITERERDQERTHPHAQKRERGLGAYLRRACCRPACGRGPRC